MVCLLKDDVLVNARRRECTYVPHGSDIVYITITDPHRIFIALFRDGAEIGSVGPEDKTRGVSRYAGPFPGVKT